jgi:uncharacterized protein YndB with AHSA1/START domain
MSGERSVIEREIFIAAAPETVFRFLVEPALMARWIGLSHTLEPQPGGLFRVEVSHGHVARGVYTDVVPPRRVAFTWGWEGQDVLPPGASLVEIDLEPRDGGTLLRLRHSGLPEAALPPFSPARHGERWSAYLARLAAVACHDPADKRGNHD